MSHTKVEQRGQALAKANHARLAMSEVRLQLAAGAIAFAEAIEDPRTEPLRAERLLCSVRGVGPVTARRVMRLAGVPCGKRVRDLTDRQRYALVFELAREAWWR